MIAVVVDVAAGQEAAAVAQRLEKALDLPAYRDLAGTVYVGCGSCDLVRANHMRPHITIPLTRTRWADALTRAQIAGSDGLILVDHDEAQRLRGCLTATPVVLMQGDQSGGLLRCETPRDAAGLDRLGRECPELVASLMALGRLPHAFDYQRLAGAVAELTLATSEVNRQ